eukprot:gene10827-11979_t
MSILSDEVNFLVYRYLQESGYKHSAFAFGVESHINDSNVNGSIVPPGALINIMQKGVQYIEAELCIHDDGSLIDDLDNLEPIPLIDAVIPEALAARAANILRSAVQNSNSVRELSLPSMDTSDDNTQVFNCTWLQGHESEVFSCVWNPSSKILATGAADGTARLWYFGSEEMEGKQIKSVVLDHHLANSHIEAVTKDVTTLEWNSNGTLLASAAIDSITRIWNTEGQQIAVLPAHTGLIFALKWNKKGTHLLSASLDKKCLVWDTASWEIKQSFEHHQGPVVDVDWQNNSTFATCSTDKTISVCKVGLEKPIKTFTSHTEEVNCIRWDPSGNLLASSSDDKTIKLWSLKQDTPLQDLVGHTKEVTLIEWCPAAPFNILASACYDASVKIWNTEQGTCLYTFNRHLEPVNAISFSPDGKYLTSATLDGIINVWSMQNSDCVYTHRSAVGLFEVKWSPDGCRIAICQTDKQVRVLDTQKLLTPS